MPVAMPEGDAGMSGRLPLPDEMILLLVGCGLPWSRQRSPVGAAGLTELVLAGRVRIEGFSGFGLRLKRLTVADRTPIGDPVFDAVLREFAELPPRRRLLYYVVKRVGAYFLQCSGDRLVERGLLWDGIGEGGSGSGAYVVRDAAAAERVRARVAGALLETAPFDRRTVALAAFVHAVNLTGCVVAPADLKAARRAGNRVVKRMSNASSLLGADEADLTETLSDVMEFVRDLAQTVGAIPDGDGGDGDGGSP